MDVSQLLNQVLGKNQDTGGVEYWSNPERAGWLMKQGDRARPYPDRARRVR